MSGELTETASFDVKEALPTARKNADLATDVAAMTTDGGVLLYGVAEDEHKRPTIRDRLQAAGNQVRCPTGECKPKSTWIKADRLHPLIPRHTAKSSALYKSRGAVEREFGRLTHEWALLPLRVRGLGRVRLHADLTILARLVCSLAGT